MRPKPARFPVFRPPPVRTVVAVILAVAVGIVVHRTTEEAAAVSSRLGNTVTVVVARHPLEAGARIEPGDVVLVDRPVAHVPAGALTDDPTGRTVRSPVVPGEVLVQRRLAGAGQGGPAALVPDGWRAVAVPVVDVPLPARPGDLVDVVASFDPSVAGDEASLVVAADAVVVDVAGDALTVAVPRGRVTDVAFALTNGIVTLALVG